LNCSSSWIQTTQLASIDKKFVIFKDGCPEKWIKWAMAFSEIENLIPLMEPADETRILWTFS
jgi:hypothetical protein